MKTCEIILNECNENIVLKKIHFLKDFKCFLNDIIIYNNIICYNFNSFFATISIMDFLIFVTNCTLSQHLSKHYHCFLSSQKTITQSGRVGSYYPIHTFLIFYLNHFFINYG
jgi:hypothetical protein